jgi:hypothetical protein
VSPAGGEAEAGKGAGSPGAPGSAAQGGLGGGANVPLINALVLYIGSQVGAGWRGRAARPRSLRRWGSCLLWPPAGASSHAGPASLAAPGCPQAKTVSGPLHPGAQEMFVRLAGELDPEGRYLLLNAMANQLRYPNAHTYYFSCT